MINLIKELLFPKRCFFCKRYNTFLCPDCRELLEISSIHRADYSHKYLSDIYAPCSYENKFIQKLIRNFKYEPFYKDLKIPLAQIIDLHFDLIQEKFDPAAAVILPVPLSSKRLRWRGFNQSQELASQLSQVWQIPAINDCLVRIKETPPQATLNRSERQKNVQDVFLCAANTNLKNKTIIVLDDIVTTGATLNECAKAIRNSQPTKIIGLAVARADKN